MKIPRSVVSVALLAGATISFAALNTWAEVTPADQPGIVWIAWTWLLLTAAAVVAAVVLAASV